jgi:hypothetical protein
VQRSRGFFSSSALASIALLGCAPAAAAETFRPRPPRVHEIEVACHVVNRQRHTIRIQSARGGNGSEFQFYRVVFQNVQNASAAPLSLSPNPMPVTGAFPVNEDPSAVRQNQFFDIPAGLYDVTVAPQYPGGAELIVRNITVPATTGTGGRGTGCRFL